MQAIIRLVNRLFQTLGWRIIKLGTYNDLLESFNQLSVIHHCLQFELDLNRIVIRDLYRTKGGGLCFIQVGANDGVRDDNFRESIEEFSLSGLMIEPQPGAFARLSSKYVDNPRIKTVNCAISRQTGHVKMYVFEDAVEGSIQLDVFSSLDIEVIRRQKLACRIRSAITSIDVDALTFDQVSRLHGIEDVDILIVDTEGYDFEVIKMVDFSKMRPTLIQIEHQNLPPSETKKAIDFLVEKGYKVNMHRWELTAVRDDYLRSLKP